MKNKIDLNDLFNKGNYDEVFSIVAEKCFPEGKIKIKFPIDVLPVLTKYRSRKQEYFLCISLDGAHNVIKLMEVTKGILNKTLVHPREVFAEPLIDRAESIIIAHNHPSGETEPSSDDDALTKRLIKAGEILGIPILDHIIIAGKNGYYSYAEDSKMGASMTKEIDLAKRGMLAALAFSILNRF